MSVLTSIGVGSGATKAVCAGEIESLKRKLAEAERALDKRPCSGA